ncbi:MAG: nicotinate-nucleotide--dimethylbenzimidazole phosphoribosyltransferase [Spirochaetes bacterium]|nr:nicotinate-nucleotide--dimethylbenzimidazole phosphoribosyltransferase [Spirochaetota bacterium]
MTLKECLAAIKPSDKSIALKIQHKIDFKTKPVGSLGALEAIAHKMSLVQETLDPAIIGKRLFVFAGDHGITAEGVSAFPAEVTPQMVLNFLSGGAAINVLCRHGGIEIGIVDMGVNFDFKNAKGLIDKKIAPGTKNFLKEDAMSETEALAALEAGIAVFTDAYTKQRFDIVGVGDMGIGNTTSASAIIAAVTGASAADVSGRGTGLDDKGLANKISVLAAALKVRSPKSGDGIDILKKVGGFEIAGIAGCVLAAAAHRVPVMLDGIISTAGGLIAYTLNPAVGDYLFCAHRSVEQGQAKALAHMNLTPILDLGMRLGEGTGAAIAIGIVDGACRIMREMASFESAGVTNKE